MAGDWIKIRKSLTRDPRVVRISSALNADRLRTIGGLVSAWCLLDEQTEDGKLEGYTPEVFDELVGVPGIAAAMASVNWLELGDGFLAAPRFEEHNGHSAKRRAQENVRKMSARDADKVPQPKRTKSALEKRREENTRKKENKSRGTESELKDFTASLGLPSSDGEACFLKWEGNGWTNKGEPVKCWKSTIRNWKLQGFLPSQKPPASDLFGKPQRATRHANGYNEQIELP